MHLLVALLLPVLLLMSNAAGWRVRMALGEAHRRTETVEALRLVMSMLVTFAAIVLGLLTSSAKTQFDTQRQGLVVYSIALIELDQRLSEYGPDAAPARAMLRAYTAAAIADTWPTERRPSGDYPPPPRDNDPTRLESAELGAMLLEADRLVAGLEPATPVQRRLIQVLEERSSAVLAQRWQLVASSQHDVPWPFLAMMVFWLVLVFATFGLSTSGNRLVHVVIALAAISVSAAVYMILEFTQPLDGLLQLSSGPLRDALAHMDTPLADLRR